MELTVKIGRDFGERRKQEARPRPSASWRLTRFFPRDPRALRRRPHALSNRTDYDKLISEIWTDGRITPDDALTQASVVLQKRLNVFALYDKNAIEFEEAVDERRRRRRR